MPERPLLLSAAKSGVLIEARRDERLRLFLIAFGVFVVLVGAADLTARAAHAVLGDRAGQAAFAPALGAVEPSVLAASSASTSATGVVPVRLRIPSIGVDAPVEQVAQKADGTMGTPTRFGDVAWYAPGGKPGAPEGSAVFAGHVDNALTSAGVFEHLSLLKPGDYVSVSGESGRTLLYRVTSLQSYPANAAPLAQIFATDGDPQLVLITCAGDWVTSERQFDQRLVVVAKPAY